MYRLSAVARIRGADSLRWAAYAAQAWLSGSALYLLALLLASRHPSAQASLEPAAQGAWVAVLVPAHDEEAGISDTVAGLEAQDHPRPLLEVIVIADNCSDRTAPIATAASVQWGRQGKIAFVPTMCNSSLRHDRPALAKMAVAMARRRGRCSRLPSRTRRSASRWLSCRWPRAATRAASRPSASRLTAMPTPRCPFVRLSRAA